MSTKEQKHAPADELEDANKKNAFPKKDTFMFLTDISVSPLGKKGNSLVAVF